MAALLSATILPARTTNGLAKKPSKSFCIPPGIQILLCLLFDRGLPGTGVPA